MAEEEGLSADTGKEEKPKSKEDELSEFIGAYTDSYMDYVEEQVRYIESLHDWWATSCYRGILQPQYPSAVSHNIWALYLINQAGWLTYPKH